MVEYQNFRVRVQDGNISLTCLDCGAMAAWSEWPETTASVPHADDCRVFVAQHGQQGRPPSVVCRRCGHVNEVPR
jgi:RNase P subunit RPR2